MRRLGALAALAVALAALASVSPASAADARLTYYCSPAPLSERHCAGWHATPVAIAWDWDKTVAKRVSGCVDQTISRESNGASVLASCTVEMLLDPFPQITVGARLEIDMTPPTNIAATPDRPPDQGGWWNHPVAFAFSGTDALSKIASCDTVTYAGPGGSGAAVVGGCHDKAGNYATRAFPLSYDATPPLLSSVKAIPRSRSARITWTSSPDTVLNQVVRQPRAKPGRSKVLYSGTRTTFNDSGLANGTQYVYTVTAFDQAGNRVSASTSATPRLSLGLKPRRATRLRRPPVLRWPAIKGASYYNVQLFRGERKVLTAWPAHAHLKLRRRWRFEGARRRLGPGRYSWYVWPGYGSRAAHRYGRFVGRSSFVIVR